MKNSNRQGFTLVEMSIVIVIVGLLIGILLEGQEMIQSARVKATVTQWEKAKVSVATFYKKFNAMPGDYNEAQRKIDAGLVNGDGDGEINNNDNGEYINVWEHLARAGMISNVEQYDNSSITRSRYRGEIRGSEFFMFYGVPNKTVAHSFNAIPSTTNVASVSLPSYSLEIIEDVLFAHDYSVCESTTSGYYDEPLCVCQREGGGVVDNTIFGSGYAVADVLSMDCYVCNVITSLVAVAQGMYPTTWTTEPNTKAYLDGCNVCGKTPYILNTLTYEYEELETGKHYYENSWFLDYCGGVCGYPEQFGVQDSFLTTCDVCDTGTAADGDGVQGARWSEFVSALNSLSGVDNIYRRCDLCVYDVSYASDSWFLDNCVCDDPVETVDYEGDYGKSALYQTVCGYCNPSEINNYRTTIKNATGTDIYDADRCNICDLDVNNYYGALGSDYISYCGVCSDPAKYIPLIGQTNFFSECNVCDKNNIEGFKASLASLSIDVYDECVCVHDAGDISTFNNYIDAIPNGGGGYINVYDECSGCDANVGTYNLYKTTTKYKDECVCQYDKVQPFESIIGTAVYDQCGYCAVSEIDTAESNITPTVDLYTICVCSASQIGTYIDGSGGTLVGDDVFTECNVCSQYATYGGINGFDEKCACADPDETYSYEAAYNGSGKNVYEVCEYCLPANITSKESLDDGAGGTIDIYSKCDVCDPDNISSYIGITKTSGTTVVDDCLVCDLPGTYGDKLTWAVYNSLCGDICEDPATYLYSGVGPSPDPHQLSWADYDSLCNVCGQKSKYSPDYAADAAHTVTDFYTLCGDCDVAYATEWGGMASKDVYINTCACNKSPIDTIVQYVGVVPATFGGTDYIDIYQADGCDICNVSNAAVYVNDPSFKATFISVCDPCGLGYDSYVGEAWFSSVCSPCDAAYYVTNYATFMTTCDPCAHDQVTYDKYKGEAWFNAECDPCNTSNVAIYAQFNTNIYQECGLCDADGMQSRYNISIPNATSTGFVSLLDVCNVCTTPSTYYRPILQADGDPSNNGYGLNKPTFESVCNVCGSVSNIQYYWSILGPTDVDTLCNYCADYATYGVPSNAFYETHCVDCDVSNYGEPWYTTYCPMCSVDLLNAHIITQAEYDAYCYSMCADPANMTASWYTYYCGGSFCDPAVNSLTDLIALADAGDTSVLRDCGYCDEPSKSVNYKTAWYASYCEDPCADQTSIDAYMVAYGENMYEFCSWCDDKNNYVNQWYKDNCEDPCDITGGTAVIDSYLSVNADIYDYCGLCDASYSGSAWLQPSSTVCDYCDIFPSDIVNCDPCYADPYGTDSDGNACDTCHYLPHLPMCIGGGVTPPTAVISVPDPCAGSTAPACLASYDDKHHFMHLMKWQQGVPSTMNSLGYVLTGEQAFEIDRKFDDGDYETGGIMVVCPTYTAKNGAIGDEIFSPLGQKRACYTSMRMDN